jgi:hypothetical protein
MDGNRGWVNFQQEFTEIPLQSTIIGQNGVLMNDIIGLGVVAVMLVAVTGIFVRICIRVRRGGGSLTTIALGATDGFLTQEKSKAAEVIVDENAGKKFIQVPLPGSKETESAKNIV